MISLNQINLLLRKLFLINNKFYNLQNNSCHYKINQNRKFLKSHNNQQIKQYNKNNNK